MSLSNFYVGLLSCVGFRTVNKSIASVKNGKFKQGLIVIDVLECKKKKKGLKQICQSTFS